MNTPLSSLATRQLTRSLAKSLRWARERAEATPPTDAAHYMYRGVALGYKLAIQRVVQVAKF